jgi:tetratricopeptide (TPR) repeat protein
MLAHARFFRRLVSISVMLFNMSFCMIRAQEGTVEDIQYKDDYDRIQILVKTSAPLKRADQLVTFFIERSNVNPQLRDYAANILSQDMEALLKQSNYVALRGLCERAIKARPKFGEVYLFYAAVLRNDGKINEAMNAYAKCYVIRNTLQAKAKQLLDVMYKASNRGSLNGQDKLIRNAVNELK